MCCSKKRLFNHFKKTAGHPNHELPYASDDCMVGLWHNKLLLGTETLLKELLRDAFLVAELVPWEPFLIEKRDVGIGYAKVGESLRTEQIKGHG